MQVSMNVEHKLYKASKYMPTKEFDFIVDDTISSSYDVQIRLE